MSENEMFLICFVIAEILFFLAGFALSYFTSK